MFQKKFFMVLLIAIVLISACAPKAEATGVSPIVPQPTSTSASSISGDNSTSEEVSSGPVGIIAIGHSGLTAYRTDPNQPDHDAKANSWATGTNPEINSIYQRLLAVHPEIGEQVSNGSHSSSTGP